MLDQSNNRTVDTYQISGKVYAKDTDLGPKSWKKIEDSLPGQTVDFFHILGVKIAKKEDMKQVVFK